MRQLSFFKEKLLEDREKYVEHFKNQQISFETSQKLINQQFEYLSKLLEIKYTEAKKKLTQYWKTCQTTYSINLCKISEQVKKFDEYA